MTAVENFTVMIILGKVGFIFVVNVFIFFIFFIDGLFIKLLILSLAKLAYLKLIGF